MVDNIDVTPGTGATVAADDVGGALYQRVKLAVGADGAAADLAPGQALMAASLPVALASDQSDVKVTLDSEAVVLGAGSAAIGKLAANSGVDIGDVDVASSALPTGAATSALQGGGLPAALAAGGGLKVEGVAGGVAVPVSVATVPSHAVTNAGTFAVQESGDALTALQTLDNIVSGSEAQVDVVAALPAGDNNIGNVDIASIAAGETLIGLIGSSDIVVTVTPTVDTSAYASGDLLFDSAEVAAAVRANGYCAVLQSVTVLDKADQGVAFTLLIANAATDFGAANSAPDPDDTEAGTVIGWVPICHKRLCGPRGVEGGVYPQHRTDAEGGRGHHVAVHRGHQRNWNANLWSCR